MECHSVTGWHRASREVESNWELLCQPCMAYWLSHCSLQHLFLSAGPCQVTDRPLAVSQFQSPVSPLLLRVPSFQFPPEPFGPKPHLPRFLPSSRRHRSQLRNRHPTDCFSALRLSQPLDGFLHLRLRGLIPSRSHVQGFLFKGFSLRAATLLRQEETSPLPLARKTAASSRWRHSQRPRLRGLTPRGDAFLRNGV